MRKAAAGKLPRRSLINNQSIVSVSLRPLSNRLAQPALSSLALTAPSLFVSTKELGGRSTYGLAKRTCPAALRPKQHAQEQFIERYQIRRCGSARPFSATSGRCTIAAPYLPQSDALNFRPLRRRSWPSLIP